MSAETILAIVFAAVAFVALAGSAVMYRLYLKKVALLKGVEDVPTDQKLLSTSVYSYIPLNLLIM